MSLVNNTQRQNTLHDAWNSANSAHGRDVMNNAHNQAEALRNPPASPPPAAADPWRPVSVITPAQPGLGGGGMGAWGAPNTQLREPTSAEQQIRDMFAAQEQANLAALRSAYDRNVLTLNAAQAQIPQEFNAAQNRVAAQSEVARMNFNERAAGQGLNRGAGSQAYLAMSSALQGNLAGLSQAEAQATSELSLQRAKLSTAYRSDVAQAIAQGNIAQARALYDDFVRVDNALVTASRNQADLDMRVWRANLDAMLAMARLSN